MPLYDHLVELRQRLIKALIGFFLVFLVAFYFSAPFFEIIAEPLRTVTGRDLIVTDLLEGFMTRVKLSAFVALLIGFPWIAGQLWMFIAPGLYRKEKAAFFPFMLATPINFYIGALIGYFVMPVLWRVLASYVPDGVVIDAKMNEYVSRVLQLTFAFGISFELPVLLTLLVRVGLVSTAALASKRRYAIVVAFIIAAVLTPPDVASQLALAVPLILLYEISIIIGRMIEKRRPADTETDESGGEKPAESSTGGVPSSPG
ncbi:MAG: twin-arginine translocase subunit TatC [Rhodospirillales bacterium]|nr:twin-arginine translocase subunit TatC [Rhodospirillales bacterium]QQS14953.1 MAG: twin-arginine translocase subunit TatC [Rhodospirillales bacterium]